MNRKLNVATALKTATFQMRINPEIKQQAESVFCTVRTDTDRCSEYINTAIDKR